MLEAFLGGGGDDGPSVNDLLGGRRRALDMILHGRPQSNKYNPEGAIPALDVGTPFSALDVATGQTTIDPLARETLLGAYGDFSGALGETRSALLGNANAFERARVNPLLERLERGRGELGRGLSRTGVRGTLRDRSLLDYDISGERALGDARAIAAQDTINAVNTIDELLFNAGSGTATNIFNQELASLGIGLDAINIINTLANNFAVGAGGVAQASAASAALVDQAQIENITGMVGAGLSAYSDLKDGD